MAISAAPQLVSVEPVDDIGIEVEPMIESNRTFDLGTLNTERVPSNIIEDFVRHGPPLPPSKYPADASGVVFRTSVLKARLSNGEYVHRDWLVWSHSKDPLFCFPWRLFSNKAQAHRPHLASMDGYSKTLQWDKLHNKIPEHENSSYHKQCYLEWRNLEKKLLNESTVDNLLLKNMETETNKWKKIFGAVIDVILFCGERGLALRGETEKIGG